jgi:hypothetical protein
VTLKKSGAPAGTLQIRWNDADIDAMAAATEDIQASVSRSPDPDEAA